MERAIIFEMPDTTLVLLIRRSQGEIVEICLAMKKRGFGVGRYNGVGGKLNEGESIEDAAIRETKEEIGIDIKDFKKCARMEFYTPHKPEWNQVVHAYLVDKWEGALIESEEVKPKWFKISDIPYQDMWPDDAYWLPEVLNGKFVNGSFVFNKEGGIGSFRLEAVDSFEPTASLMDNK